MAIRIVDGQCSNSGDAILTTSYADDYTVRGYEWTCNDVDTLTSGQTLACLLDLSSVPSSDGIFVLPITLTADAEEVQFRLYENTDYTGGTTKEVINRNRAFQQSKNFAVTTGATGTDKGDLLVIHSAFASSRGAVTFSTSGGTSNPMVLDPTKNYLIEIENLGSGSTRVEYDFEIFEIPVS